MGFVLLLFTLNACIPDIEVLDESDQWNPYFGVPLVTTTVDMEELLSSIDDNDIITTDANGLLTVAYQERISITVPPAIPPIPDFLIEVEGFSQTWPNPTGGDSRFDIIQAKSGTLRYTMANPHPEDVQVVITLEDALKDGVALQWPFTIPAAPATTDPTMQQGTISLADYQLDLSDGFRVSYTATLATSGSPVGLHPFLLDMQDIDHSYLQGYFGQFELATELDSVHFGFLDKWEQGVLDFVDPTITFQVHSTYGLPIDFRKGVLGFHTFRNGYTEIVNADLSDGVSLKYPNLSEVGSALTTTIPLNASNSNVASIISGVPYQLDYLLIGAANPTGDTTLVNFVTDSARVDVDVEVNIPIYGTARNFRFEEVFDFDTEGMKELERAGIKLVAENGFPIEARVQLYFLDMDGGIVDSLYTDTVTPTMRAARVDGNGDVTQVETTERLSEFSTVRFEAIKAETTQLRMVATMSTANNGQQPVRIYDHYDLRLKFGLLARL